MKSPGNNRWKSIGSVNWLTFNYKRYRFTNFIQIYRIFFDFAFRVSTKAYTRWQSVHHGASIASDQAMQRLCIAYMICVVTWQNEQKSKAKHIQSNRMDRNNTDLARSYSKSTNIKKRNETKHTNFIYIMRRKTRQRSRYVLANQLLIWGSNDRKQTNIANQRERVEMSTFSASTAFYCCCCCFLSFFSSNFNPLCVSLYRLSWLCKYDIHWPHNGKQHRLKEKRTV